jgi:mannose-6-phosphate isomerase-like protein (cupin superfamily)
MSSPTIVPVLAGRVLGSPGDGFAIAEWQDAGGPPHVHYRDDEAWYVLEGTLCVRLGDGDVEARAGSGVFAPRGTPHTYWNPGPGRLRYLLVITSKIYRPIQEIHAMPDRSRPALEAVFRKYDSELIG